MMFPRILAFSEQMWTPQKNKNYDNFMKRLKIIKLYFQRQGIEFAKPNTVANIPQKTTAKFDSSMGIYKTYVPQYMFDSNDVTWYVTKNIPDVGDYVKIEFSHFKYLSSLSVYADSDYMHDFAKEKPYDQFGILEISTDGVNFKQCGRFSQGVVEVKFPTKEKVKTIRIKITEKQKSNLVISEVDFTE